MKKYLIFDLGEVMVRFSPILMCKKLIGDDATAEKVCQVLFDRLYWDRLDAGTIDDDELLGAVEKRLSPALFAFAKQIYASWFLFMPEIPGMRSLALEMKERFSLSLALLSNTARAIPAHEEEIPILSIFDKKIYSATAGFSKPSPEIFDYTCKLCGISPDEAVFVDDNENNVKAAERFGISAIRFTGDSLKLREELIEILSE